jgi:hypothetical protein
MLVTFILLIFFDASVKGIFKVLLPALVLITPLVNLYALEFLDPLKLKSFFLNRWFKIASATSLVCLVVLSSILMTQGKDSEIYVTAFSNLVEKDDTYSGSLNPSKVYISKNIYPEIFSSKTSGVIPEESVEALKTYSNANSIELIFYDDKNPLQYNDLGEVEGGGVRVIFGESSKTLLFSEIEASIYIANMASGGTTYTLHRWFGGWRLWSSEMAWIS